MPTTLTPEQILALAPDSSSAQAGRGLANPRKWVSLGQSDVAAWGECQGSGKDAYKVQIDLREPAFRCSCPSRKFPCKHGLGLLLLLANQPAALAQSAPPAWVAEWMAKRDQSAQKKAAASAETETEPPSPKRAASRARTVSAREGKVADGMAEVERWLRDQIRQGLASAQGRSSSAWDTVAARMVDAQAPGLAGMLRDMGGTPATGEGWQGRLLEQIGLVHLLIEGYKRREELPPDLLLELRTQIGWTQEKEAVQAGPALRDRWIALGQRVVEEEQLRSQRTWLWGCESGRIALLLDFAVAGRPLERSLVVGTQLEADLAFFGGSYPLRALLVQRHAPPQPAGTPPGHPTLDAGLAAYSAALARNPWLERFPLPLREVTPRRAGERWLLGDSAGRAVPLSARGSQGWRLLALSGGRPLTLFGEWDGAALTPLSAWAEGRTLLLG
jgi:hypothetical protein